MEYAAYTFGMKRVSIPKRQAYHHGDLRETLILLALETLEASGPEAIALRNLAERAGVSVMAPYRHFADKATLLDAVARTGFRELSKAFHAVDDASNPRKALLAFGIAYVRFAHQRPGLFRLMFEGPPLVPYMQLSTDPNTAYGLITQRLDQLLPPARRQTAVLAFRSMIHGFAILLANGRVEESAPEAEVLIRRFGRILMKGLLD